MQVKEPGGGCPPQGRFSRRVSFAGLLNSHPSALQPGGGRCGQLLLASLLCRDCGGSGLPSRAIGSKWQLLSIIVFGKDSVMP